MDDSNQATQLIPSWTYEDFLTDTPYKWLYEQRGNKFLLQRMIEAAKRQAKEVKFAGFVKVWNSYVETISPKTSVLGEAETMFPEQPVQLRCGDYTCDDNGIHRYSELSGEIEVISHPIMPIKRVTNIETYEEKLEVAYKRGKDGWKNLTVPRDTLASAQRIVGLSKQGVCVTSENAKEVVRYMADIESRNYDDLPRQNSVGHMGWLPDGRFMPYVDDISYDGESPEFAKIYSELHPAGSEQTWMDIAKSVRAGDSVPARIALATGFAGPLVKKLGKLPFIVHLWGEKGCGKTVALMLAASIYGYPEVGGYAKSFSGTKVAMELHAAFCGNLPVFLDELQVVNDNRKNFDEIIYMLCEGSGKARGAKDGGMQLQRRWSTCVMTTGETPIIQSNSGGGAIVRTLEINYKDRPLFGTDERAIEVAELLKQNYGWAGKKFVEQLQKESVIEVLNNYTQQYYNELKANIEAKQVLSASVILAADKLADAVLFHDKRNLTPDDIREFLVTKDESDVNLRCYQWLIGVIGANPRRFDKEEEQSGEVWGMLEEGRAYIIRNVFDRLLRSEGYNPSSFLKWADNRALLKREAFTGDKRLTTRKRFNGVLTACVGLLVNGTTSKMQEVNVDDLPF